MQYVYCINIPLVPTNKIGYTYISTTRANSMVSQIKLGLRCYVASQTRGNTCTYKVENPCFFTGLLLSSDSHSVSSTHSPSPAIFSWPSMFLLSLPISLSPHTGEFLSFPLLASLLTWMWLVLLADSGTNVVWFLDTCATLLWDRPGVGT